MRRSYVIVVDTRAQLPLLFRRIIHIGGRGRILKTERRKLDAGDYALAEAPRGMVVERKGSISEIAKNMLDTADKGRQARAFDKLCERSSAPILLVEQTIGELMRPTKYAPEPLAALDALLLESLRRNISLWFVGNCRMPARRRLVGNLVARAMIVYAENT